MKIQNKFVKRISGNSFRKFITGILAVTVILFLTSTQLLATDYTTIADGNWTSSSTWQGGSVPPTGDIPSSVNIFIRHAVDYNSGNDLKNEGTIRIEPTTGTTAKLIIPHGVNVEILSSGELYVINGYFLQYRFIGGGNSGTQQDGNFKNIGGYVKVQNSVMEVSQDFTSESGGERYFENCCILTGQNYSVSGGSSDDTYISVNLSLGWHGSGNFQLSDGTMDFTDMQVQLAGTSGNFQLSSGHAFGDITFITMKNHVTNGMGNGAIQVSSSINNSPSLVLDAYWANTYEPNRMVSGTQTHTDLTNTYFPGNCTPGGGLTGPTAVDNDATTNQGVPVDIDVLTNDIEGDGALDPTSVTFVSGTTPNPTTVGIFTVHPTTGLVTFTPVAAFTGVTTVDYQVCDVNSLCDVATITVTVNPVNDTDGDGVPDPDDDYPTDPDRAFDHFYPATGFGTLAYEDLWPGQGDYDFNDLITDYRFQMVTNASNNLVEIFGTFIIKAFGATLHNGFGFQFANSNISQSHLNVTGHDLTAGIISNGANGLENGQTIPTIILFDDYFDLMQHPGSGIGINTTPGSPYVTPHTVNIYIGFTGGTYTLAQLDIADFNPFMFVSQTRGHEIHLPDYAPTSLVDPSIFGSAQDNSIPSQGKYYKTESNLPWAINIYESFDYPQEKIDIITVYHHFVEWAVSGGIDYPDWYQDNAGYRDNTKIY
ncbi:MAG: LruC domain-containing protein [Bacteroidales bacterium]|nr:LruC domain-containing protein [Bacteroidota bacterium]MBL6950084.1 LruC domain-containing protein [Bacteroidales bacterium]